MAPTTGGEPIISLRGISRTYDMGHVTVPALRDVDLDVHRGEFLAIVGPSGSGKSTMMNIVGCLDRPTAGTYRLAGTPVEELDDDGLAQRPQPDDRVRVPVVQPAAADDRARERRDAAALPGRRPGGADAPGDRGARAARPRRPRHPRAVRAVRRPAAARRRRPGPGHGSRPDPRRRADGQPRPGVGPRRPRPAARAQPRGQHDRPHHPRRRRSPPRPAARCTSATGGSWHEDPRAHPARVLAPPDGPPPGRPDDAGRDHRRRVGGRPGRRGAGDDLEHHRAPVEPRARTC